MIQKQNVSLNFSQGLDTKTDPRQVSLGKFSELNNTVFQVGGRLTKRNGFEYLASAPVTNNATYLTTISGNLTAIGSAVYAYNQASTNWISKGNYQPLSLSTLALIRNSINQIQSDAAVASNGLVCTAYTETTGNVETVKYAIANSVTGQNIVSPVAIPVGSGTPTGSPKVFLVGNYFVIVFTNVISGTPHLQYIAISINDTTVVTPNRDIAATYAPSSTVAWDAVVFDLTLFVAYNTTTGGQSVQVTSISSQALSLGQSPAAPTTFAGSTATIVSVCVDSTTTNPLIYISFYENTGTAGTSTGFTAAVDTGLNVAFAPQSLSLSNTQFTTNLASSAQNGSCQVFAEIANFYGYDAAIPTHFIFSETVSSTGTVGGAKIVVRSVGLASKSFIINNVVYFLAAYQSSAAAGAGYQPTYFLINGTLSTSAAPIVAAKLAYSNGGGYLERGLPSVTVTGNIAQISYLFKDLIAAQAPAGLQSINLQSPQVYSQTGINLVSFTIGDVLIDSVEIAGSLQLSGGFGWMYDGYLPVEENFFLWPDSVEVSLSTGSITPTGDTVSGSNTLINVSSTAGLGLGMKVTGTGIPANQFVTSFTASTITFGPGVASSSNVGITITLAGNIGPQPDGTTNANAYYYQALYSWTDNNGNAYNSAPSIPVAVTTTGTGTTGTYLFTVNIPTLRLTYKTANKVKIRLFRWSVANPVYYEVTSIPMPTLNSTATDYVTIVDAFNDTSIVGNSIIYTTGGVLEDINSPAADIIWSFDTRAWKIDKENPNTAWYSKTVIPNTPVEWSDLQTLYIAPNIGTEAQAGPVLAAAPMDDKSIFFHQGVIDYINGTGPDATGANSQYSQPTFITSTVGCSNQQSIVLMQNGLMFQASNGKGIWLLGRDLSTQYIGAPVETYNSFRITSAVNVPSQNQVRFLLENGKWLTFDYYYNQWGTFSGLGGLPSTSSCVFQSMHTFINTLGQVYQEATGSYMDGANPVLMNFTTSWLQLAGLQGYQRSYFFYLLAEYFSPHKLNVGISYDFNNSIAQSSMISPTNFSSATPSPFGVPTPFGGPTSLEQWRVFLAQQRCQSFRITIQEVYDETFGVPPGAGFAMSGINLVVGLKKGWRTISNAESIGGGTNRG